MSNDEIELFDSLFFLITNLFFLFFSSVAKIHKKRNVSCREYYCYKLQIRSIDTSILLHSGRLLQQYVVDMYVKLES